MGLDLSESIKSLLSFGGSNEKSPQQIKKDEMQYSNEPMYFKRGSELNDQGPGNKMNRSQVDAIINHANMGVTMGLISPDSADKFIATQFQEMRNDFAVNAVDAKGNTITHSITPGKVYNAAQALYGMQSGQGVNFIEPNPEKKTGREYSLETLRYKTEDKNSPYTKNIPPEQLNANAKAALLTWISKGEDPYAWNGAGPAAMKHGKEVMNRAKDLVSEYNSELRQYMSDRFTYNSKYKVGAKEDLKSQYKSVGDLEKKLNPTEQEMNIVNYHKNTISSGKVGTDSEGQPVTVYSTGIGPLPDGPNKGKFVAVPGYFNGKINSEEESYKHWKKEIDSGKWPTYPSAKELNARSKDLHQIMDYQVDEAVNSRAKSKK